MSDEIIVIDGGSGKGKTKRGGSVKTYNSLFERVDDSVVSELPNGNGPNRGSPILIDLGTRGQWHIDLEGPQGFNDRLMGLNRYTNPVWADLMVIAAFTKFPALLRQSNPVVKLGVTAPYAYLKNVDTGGLDVEDILTKKMKGTFPVPYGKKTVNVRVASVKVWGEGLVGYAWFAYDKELKLKPDYRDANTLFLDIGRYTINTALMTGGFAHRDTIKSEPWGIDLLYRMIIRELDQSAGRITTDQVEEMIVSGEMTAAQKKVVETQTAIYIETTVRYARSVESQVHKPIDRVATFGGSVKVIPIIKEALNAEFAKAVWGDEFTNIRGAHLLLGGVDEWDEGQLQ